MKTYLSLVLFKFLFQLTFSIILPYLLYNIKFVYMIEKQKKKIAAICILYEYNWSILQLLLTKCQVLGHSPYPCTVTSFSFNIFLYVGYELDLEALCF